MNKSFCLLLIVLLSILQLGNTQTLASQLRSTNFAKKGPSYNLTLSKDYTILAVASYCEKKCL